jgi:hypothetical protein
MIVCFEAIWRSEEKEGDICIDWEIANVLWLTDPQRFQCRIVDLTGNGKLVDGLEPANRSFGLLANQAIDRTMIVTEFR